MICSTLCLELNFCIIMLYMILCTFFRKKKGEGRRGGGITNLHSLV